MLLRSWSSQSPSFPSCTEYCLIRAPRLGLPPLPQSRTSLKAVPAPELPDKLVLLLLHHKSNFLLMQPSFPHAFADAVPAKKEEEESFPHGLFTGEPSQWQPLTLPSECLHFCLHSDFPSFIRTVSEFKCENQVTTMGIWDVIGTCIDIRSQQSAISNSISFSENIYYALGT